MLVVSLVALVCAAVDGGGGRHCRASLHGGWVWCWSMFPRCSQRTRCLAVDVARASWCGADHWFHLMRAQPRDGGCLCVGVIGFDDGTGAWVTRGRHALGGEGAVTKADTALEWAGFATRACASVGADLATALVAFFEGRSVLFTAVCVEACCGDWEVPSFPTSRSSWSITSCERPINPQRLSCCRSFAYAATDTCLIAMRYGTYIYIYIYIYILLFPPQLLVEGLLVSRL